MNSARLKSAICAVAVVVLLFMAITSKDVINSQLFAGIGIIIAAIFQRNLSNQNLEHYE
jgi:hypothetical protein